MSSWILQERVYLAFSALAFCAAVARILRCRWTVLTVSAGLGIGFFFLYLVAMARDWDGATYRDFVCFWCAGRDTLDGREAYAESYRNNRPVVNPPTALPLYAALALLPRGQAFLLWTVVNGILVLALVPLARRVLAGERSSAVRGLDTTTVFILAIALALSNATRSHLINGQAGILVAFMLLLACLARGSGRPFSSAAALTVATIKIGTMLPFGLLFWSRHARPTLIWLAGLVLVLCLGTAGITAQWGRAEAIAAAINRLSREGCVNDYSRAGPHPADILGFDKLYYHLGVTDRSCVRMFQAVSLAFLALVLMAGLAKGQGPPGLFVSLLALYSVVFLYHRNYDKVVLALPLAFAAGHARTLEGRSRIWMTVAAFLMLLNFYLPRKLLFRLMHQHIDSPVMAGLIEWVVLPSATWLVLLSMACLYLGGRGLSRQLESPAPDEDGGLITP